MAEFPSMPLFTDAYLADTKHLTTIEHGAYLMLLMCMWRSNGSLPNDDRMLCRYTGLSSGQWKRIKPVLWPFFEVTETEISQGRLTDELTFVRQRRTKSSDSAKARWLKNKEVAHANASPEQCERNAPTPTPTEPYSPLEGTDEKKQEKEPEKNKQTGNAYTDDFEAFWKAYPKRSGTNPKLPAFKKWKGFIKSGVDKDLIIQGAAAYAKSREGQDAQFTQQASTWLNQAGWEQFTQDEAHTNGKSETVTINGQLRWKHEVVAKVIEFHETGDWSQQTMSILGPPPGELGCVIPADILRQGEKLH